MTDKTPDLLPDDETPRPGESFLGRFHRRKSEARLAVTATEFPEREANYQDASLTAPTTSVGTADETETPLSDADMPPLESLSADSDYTGLLSSGVSEPLRRAALRKLFHGDEFNVIDLLDEYAEDFTKFEALGDIVTSDMRHMIEVELKKKAEALEQAMLEGDDSMTPAHAENDGVPEPEDDPSDNNPFEEEGAIAGPPIDQ